MKKLFFLAVFSCFTLATSFAQLGVGLRVGYGASSTSQELVNGMKRTLGMNPTFGLILNYDLDLHFSAVMELNYVPLSESLEYDTNFYPGNAPGSALEVKTTPKIGYLQIPILGRVTFGEKKLKTILTFGPYFGIGTKGKWTNGPNAVNGGSYILMNKNIDNVKFQQGDFRKLDIGGMIGFGGQYQIGKNGTLFLEARIQLGFLDFYNKQTSEQVAGFTTKQNEYLKPSGSWRTANVSLGYFHTFKLPKKKSSSSVKKAGKQKR
jgi:Outer membrane protein beta-barrel domain